MVNDTPTPQPLTSPQLRAMALRLAIKSLHNDRPSTLTILQRADEFLAYLMK